jgi:16S rRNA (guanine527-N7)-methyltransferase
LTAIRDLHEARRFLLDDALRALPLVRTTEGPIVDVGSGGGSPGFPIAAALPEREVTLLDAGRRKCAFLRTYAEELANVEVVWGRAEDQEPETFAVALAKALAKPPVATELVLPLVREGGIAVVWIGATADATAIRKAAENVAGAVEHADGGLVVIRKVGPTPAGFPRKAGMAKKRPLA